MDSRRQPGRAPPPRAAIVDRPVAEPLTDAELGRMREHLKFLRRYRRALRMKLNATEAAMVEGTVEPTARGVCKHLLSKLDRAAIQAALARKPLSDSAAQRAEFLAGAVSISSDVGVLLDYLETQRDVRSQAQTARAFAFAVDRIDFAGISASRLGRLLQVMVEVHDDNDLVHVLFGLLASQSFTTAFDTHRENLAPDIVAAFVPLRATYAVLQDQGLREEGAALEEGLRRLLTGEAAAFGTHSPAVRERLAVEALGLDVSWAVDSSGVHRVLGRAPIKSKLYRKLGYLRAMRLVRLGRDDEAIRQLDGILSVFPGALEALGMRDRLALLPRVGRLSVERRGPGPLCSAFDLRSMSTVLVRIADSPEASATELHKGLCLPGVAPVLDSGVDGPLSWVSVPATPTLLTTLLAGSLELTFEQALIIAADGVRVLSALALAGVCLPDLDPARLQLDLGGTRPQLLLADLSGATEGQSALSVGLTWCRRALSWPPFQGDQRRVEVSPALAKALGDSQSFTQLVEALNAR